jgi:hypothetical protein
VHWGDLGGQDDTPGPPWFPRYFSSPPDLFRPSTYLGIPPRPTERPGNTRTGRLLVRGRAPGRMGIPTSPVWQGVGIIAAWFAAGIWIYLPHMIFGSTTTGTHWLRNFAKAGPVTRPS